MNSLPKGVLYDQRSGRYIVIVWKDGERQRVGTYDTPEEAAKARDAYVRKYTYVGYTERSKENIKLLSQHKYAMKRREL